MQTILRIVCSNRSLAHMVDDFILRFCEKATGEAPAIDFPSASTDDVAFAMDDCAEPQAPKPSGKRTNLGSFGPLPNQVNENTKFVFVNPIILSYRPNRHRLCVWIGGPSSDPAGEMESD